MLNDGNIKQGVLIVGVGRPVRLNGSDMRHCINEISKINDEVRRTNEVLDLSISEISKSSGRVRCKNASNNGSKRW